MTNEFGEGDRTPVELPDLPREGRPSIPPPPGRAFAAPRGDGEETNGRSDDRDTDRQSDTGEGRDRNRGERG
ncbi:MAG: hypothetical protein ACO288_08310, partial [Ilumatobacteraceae bacterium]